MIGGQLGSAANQIADIMGKKAVTVRYAARRLGEEGLIPEVARTQCAPSWRQRSRHRNAWRHGTVRHKLHYSSRDSRTGENHELDKGGDPSIVLMGEDQTPTAMGGFGALINAIRGHDDEVTGTVQCLGLQFCKGHVRAFAKWERMKDRVYFGINQLPSGMLQEVSINTSVLDALRQIPVKTPSFSNDGSETAEPIQFAPGPASVSSESPSEPPLRASSEHAGR